MTPERIAETLTEAQNWLRAISDWLLSTDNDMKLPTGILDSNPLDLADNLTAARTLLLKEQNDG